MSDSAVDAAAHLGPEIVELRQETERERRLPERVVEALVEAQLYRLSLPSDLGAPEAHPLTSLRVYEELAKAEPAVAWNVWNSSLPCLLARYLEPDVRQDIFGDPTHKYTSSTRPSGRAVRDNGAFRLSGRWTLVSGCMHADWIGLMHLVERDGEVEILDHGAPHVRMAFMPMDAVEVRDTWHVGGLRGTGSHDVVVEDVVVDAARTFTPMSPSRLDHPLGRLPIGPTMSAGHASMCIGIAQAALDAVIELAKTKVSPDSTLQLPDRESNQFLVADAGVRLSALRAELHRAQQHLWDLAVSVSEITPQDIGDGWAAAVTAARESGAIVSRMYEMAGTSALYQDFPLERHQRDIRAALQHVVAQRFWLEEAGRVRFGMDPRHPMFFL